MGPPQKLLLGRGVRRRLAESLVHVIGDAAGAEEEVEELLGLGFKELFFGLVEDFGEGEEVEGLDFWCWDLFAAVV